MFEKYQNTSRNAPEERREYIDGLYREYEQACKEGVKEEKFRIKRLLQNEGVNSYDYYSKESFAAFLLGLIGIIAIVLAAFNT